jgi:hypothetical protein
MKVDLAQFNQIRVLALVCYEVDTSIRLIKMNRRALLEHAARVDGRHSARIDTENLSAAFIIGSRCEFAVRPYCQIPNRQCAPCPSGSESAHEWKFLTCKDRARPYRDHSDRYTLCPGHFSAAHKSAPAQLPSRRSVQIHNAITPVHERAAHL